VRWVVLAVSVVAVGVPGSSERRTPTHVFSDRAGDVVIRLQWHGGYPGLAPVGVVVPDATVYGDGLVLAWTELRAAMPRLRVTRISRVRLNDLVDRMDQLRNATFGNPRVMDAGLLHLTMNADGRRTTLSIEAPGPQDDGRVNPVQRMFRGVLRGLAEQIIGLVSGAPDWDVPAISAYIQRESTLWQLHEPRPWPLDRGLDTVGQRSQGSEEWCAVLRGSDMTDVLRAADGIPDWRYSWWRSGQLTRLVVIRPVLPDDVGCE
jgi:hypothetical protein